MDALTRTAIAALLQTSESIRAEAGENILVTLLERLGIRRHGTAEQKQLRALLFEMGARKEVDVAFDAADPERIVAVGQPRADDGAERARLRQEIGDLRRLVIELKSQMQADAGDVEAAADLVAQAERAQNEAVTALETLRAEHAAVLERLALAQTVSPRTKDRRRIAALERQLAAASTTIDQLNAQLKELRKELRQLKVRVEQKPTVHVRSTSNPEMIILGCGCVVRRVSTDDCRYGGMDHPFLVIAPVDDDADEVMKVISNALGKMRTTKPNQ